MNIKYEKVFERDIDLLLINKFLNDKKVVNLFLNKINLSNYDVVGVAHSLMDNSGESDVTIILKNDNQKIALLIEDKIDAIAMPNQRERYNVRGEKGIQDNNYNSYYVFIIAPQDYLVSNKEAQKYENQISYEELLSNMSDDLYAKSLLEHALEEKKKGYSVIENVNVTKFWNRYYELIEEKYPFIRIKRYEGPRGKNAIWPGFYTPVKGIMIAHKSDRGYMDLTFPSLADKYFQVMELISDKLDPDMSLEVVTHSLAIRIKVPIVNFEDEFDKYISELDICFNAADRLQNLLNKIDYNKVLSLKGPVKD